jgi:uncharacterized protein YueI
MGILGPRGILRRVLILTLRVAILLELQKTAPLRLVIKSKKGGRSKQESLHKERPNNNGKQTKKGSLNKLSPNAGRKNI